MLKKVIIYQVQGENKDILSLYSISRYVVPKRQESFFRLSPFPSCGGRIVALGTPEEVAEVEESYTGKILERLFLPRTNTEKHG
jgi:hypothetical protein